MMNKHYHFFKTIICWLLLSGSIAANAFAEPVVSLPEKFVVTPGNQIIIPIDVKNVADTTIGGYAFRLEYDTDVLSNPDAIATGTFSEGLPDLYIVNSPQDGVGKYSIGTGFGFSAKADGTLIKIQFDVSSDFSGSTSLSFAGVNNQTAIFSSFFDPITATFQNGLLITEETQEIPKVEIPSSISAPCGEQIDVPINLSNISNTIGGYALRIDYDDSILSNPTPIDTNTLSEGNSNINQVIKPVDGIGKFSVGIPLGLNANEDGTLIIIRFNVSSDFQNGTTAISFANKNTSTCLIDTSLNKLPASFLDGTLSASCSQKYVIKGSAQFDYLSGGTFYIKAYADSNYLTHVKTRSYDVQSATKSIQYTLSLPSGSYYLKSFIDTNADGKQDSQAGAYYHELPISINNSDIEMPDMQVPWPRISKAVVALDMDISTISYQETISDKHIENSIFIEQNQNIKIPIVCQDCKDVDSYEVVVEFDPAKLEFVKCDEDDLNIGLINILKKNGGESLGVIVSPGNGNINISNTLTGTSCEQTADGSGILGILSFNVLDAQSESIISISSVYINNCHDEVEKVTTLKNGKTDPCLACDFNKDNIVNYIDLGLLADHWLFTENLPEWNPIYNLNHSVDPDTGLQIINYLDLGILGDHWLFEINNTNSSENE